MRYQMVFLVGAPRSGTTLLERMLSAHSMVQGGPEPHLMTPLAHLGVWAKVDRAPYDHILAAEAQRGFVAALPNGEADYWSACRAYCDVLYGRYIEATGGRKVCLDKTPAYGLILPFIAKVYPDAKYVILTRHPAALFSSFANSFFDGDYAAAQAHNPILRRYVPALAAFLRQEEVPAFHVRYEDLVQAPEAWFEKICGYIGIPYEPDAVDYGERESAPRREGLGDPIGVAKHTRPTTASLGKWVKEVAGDSDKRAFLEAEIAQLDPEDLATLGYPVDTIWADLEGAKPVGAPRKQRMTRYRFQRRAIMRLRNAARHNAAFRGLLEKIRLTTDVLLRE